MNCGKASTDFVNIGCPGYPQVKNNITNWKGICTCKAPTFNSAAGARIANELISNRMGSDMSWILEPWQSGPPYNFVRSYKIICHDLLDRVGCPHGEKTIVATDAGNYQCNCGSFKTSSVAVQNMIIDQFNKQQLQTMPVFENPVYLSTALTVCMLIMGKLGAVTACFFKIPPIIGYILIGLGIQNFLNPMILKGPGFPYPSFASEAKTFALTIVLLRAGLSIEIKTISRDWVPNLCLSFVPYMCEFLPFSTLFGWTDIEMGLFSAMISSVSPSLVIPGMINLLASTKHDYGFIPKIILLSTPIESVIAVLLFSIFSMLNQSAIDPLYPWVHVYPLYVNCLFIPLNIMFSSCMGFFVGYMVSKYIRIGQKNELLWLTFSKNLQLGSSTADLIFVLVVSAYTMMCLCQKQYIAQSSGVLVVFVTLLTLQNYCDKRVAKDLADGLKGIWVFAEVFLFTFVGTNLSLNPSNGPLIGQRGIDSLTFGHLICCLLAGTAARGVGHAIILPVIAKTFPPHRMSFKWLSTFYFGCFITQLPKASVQATLGGAALAMHLIPGATGVNKAFIILQCSVITILLYVALGTLLNVWVGYPLMLSASNMDKEAGRDSSTSKYLASSAYYSKVDTEEANPAGNADEVDDNESDSPPVVHTARTVSASGFIIPSDVGTHEPASVLDVIHLVAEVALHRPESPRNTPAHIKPAGQ
jgi:solute carrier family 9B (sodium/hydrogen exchanger), member 1/2